MLSYMFALTPGISSSLTTACVTQVACQMPPSALLKSSRMLSINSGEWTTRADKDFNVALAGCNNGSNLQLQAHGLQCFCFLELTHK